MSFVQERERRSNAGSRMRALLNQEMDMEELFEYNEEDDEEFSAQGIEEEEDKLDSDFDLDSSEGEQENIEEGKALDKQLSIEEKRARRTANPAAITAKPIIKPKEPKEKKKCKPKENILDISLEDRNTRYSSRKNTILNRILVEDQLREFQKKKALQPKRDKRVIVKLTQEELLAEAALTEEKNKSSLLEWQQKEAEKRENAKKKEKAGIAGPFIRYHSYAEDYKTISRSSVVVPSKRRLIVPVEELESMEAEDDADQKPKDVNTENAVLENTDSPQVEDKTTEDNSVGPLAIDEDVAMDNCVEVTDVTKASETIETKEVGEDTETSEIIKDAEIPVRTKTVDRSEIVKASEGIDILKETKTIETAKDMETIEVTENPEAIEASKAVETLEDKTVDSMELDTENESISSQQKTKKESSKKGKVVVTIESEDKSENLAEGQELSDTKDKEEGESQEKRRLIESYGPVGRNLISFINSNQEPGADNAYAHGVESMNLDKDTNLELFDLINELSDWRKKEPKPNKPILCPITGNTAKYRDPKTNVPYANLTAYNMVHNCLHHKVNWSSNLGLYLGDMPSAKGVPEDWDSFI